MLHLDLTDLRLFRNVHEAGTITGGASSSHITLASASERIRGMEETLGTALLLRERRGVRLTAAGQTLLHHARLVLEQMDRLQGEIGQHAGGIRGHVRMLCNTSALSEHLPEKLSDFLARHAGINVDLEERSSPDIADALRQHRCDIGVLSDATDLEGLSSFVFRADPLTLIVPQGHALAVLPRAALADALDLPFIGLAEGSALQDLVTLQGRRLGQRPNYRIRLRSFESVCRMVGLGIGVAVVPQAVALRCARQAKIRRIALSDAWARRSLVVCVRQVDELPVHVREMLRHLLAPG
jgi:DNA-binding transcriptional LysR family regulator